MASAAVGIRERVMAAGARIKRVKRLDRLATVVITFGGIFIVVSVSFIFLFIFGQAFPLFRSADGRALGTLTLAAPPPAVPAAATAPAEPVAVAPVVSVPGAAAVPAPVVPRAPLAFGMDEYQMYLYELLADGRLAFFKTSDGAFAREFALTAAPGATIVAGSRSLLGDYVAAGTSDGRVALRQVHSVPRYEEQRLVDLDLELRDRGLLDLDPARRPVRALAYQERDSWQAVAAQLADDEIAVYRKNLDDGAEQRYTVRAPSGEKITALQLGRTDTLAAGTANGRLYLWELDVEPKLVAAVSASEQEVTALQYSLGSNSVIVGDAGGALSAWFRVRLKDEDTELSLVKAHQYAAQGQAITAIAPSARDRSFVTAGADGALVLRHFTSERSVLSYPATGSRPEDAILTPRADGIVVRRTDGTFARYEIRNPHPEVSWRALFGKVWYEGYANPEYVWQSTGATDDFESKFSLVPLVFGTIKGTLYAMLFAVPIAIMAALYTSQFAHPSIRQRIKPIVEIMAALPSVVVGFIAGLWLASRVETHIVPILLMVAVLPAFGTAGVLFWDRLPHGLRRRLKPGMELALIVPLAAAGAYVALKLGPGVEGSLFGGDFKHWLSTALGLVYDQRNSLVVGLAMGFAVIPIIFTISEDSFSSVPSHLTAASLALGASRWQTALRVVLPTASPGIFSAVMIGFGRAVGETMIVLMATGNTPVLDWSIFNGMRTLSANIAVEIPEAPYGGTLYRVLFLAGGVLFLMTFFVNTIAELIRQRLRERYRAL
jgi:phosphate transport system permease protein